MTSNFELTGLVRGGATANFAQVGGGRAGGGDPNYNVI